MKITIAAALAATISLGLVSPVLANGEKTGSAVADTAAVAAFDGRPYASIIEKHASAYGVPLQLAHAIVSIESNYRPNVTGRAGEVGLMQIKPATARGMGYSGSTKALYDPDTNIRWGMKYLAGAISRSDGTTCGTILKYNAGHFAKRMNPVSRNYCRKVQVELARL